MLQQIGGDGCTAGAYNSNHQCHSETFQYALCDNDLEYLVISLGGRINFNLSSIKFLCSQNTITAGDARCQTTDDLAVLPHQGQYNEDVSATKPDTRSK